METLEKLLDRLFYSPQLSSGFSSLRNLYLEAKKHDKRVTYAFVRNWASKQDAYTLHRLRAPLLSAAFFMLTPIVLYTRCCWGRSSGWCCWGSCCRGPSA